MIGWAQREEAKARAGPRLGVVGLGLIAAGSRVWSGGDFAEGGGEGGDDVGLLVVGELGEDGDGEALVCGGFGVGEVAFFVSEVAEAFL